MKYVHQRDGHASGDREFPRGSRWTLGSAGRAACLLAALCLPAAAQDGGSNDGGQLSSGGDETIGTLPIIGSRNVKLPTVEGWRGNRPAFYVQGTTSDLESSLLFARGNGFITIEVLDPSHDLVRLAFHGNVSVAFDRDLMETLPIQTGIAVPASFAPEDAILNMGSLPSRSLRLHPGILPLAIGELSASHALDRSPLQVRTFGGSGRVTTARLCETRDRLILRQSN